MPPVASSWTTCLACALSLVLSVVAAQDLVGEHCLSDERLAGTRPNATACFNDSITSAPPSCPSTPLLAPWPHCLQRHRRCPPRPSRTPEACPAPAVRFRSFILPKPLLCSGGSSASIASVTPWAPVPARASSAPAAAHASEDAQPAGHQQPEAGGALAPPAPPPAPPPPGALELKPRRRVNLAAESEGAAVLAACVGAKKPHKAIDRDADSFLRSDCAADKWLVVELAQVARIEDVEVTMKELYSCRIREFALHCSRELPAHLLAADAPADPAAAFAGHPWRHLGNFTADNRRGSQAFAVGGAGAAAWCKYLALLVHSHYGTEPVFALNSIAAFGITAAEDLEMALTQLPPAAAPPAAVLPATAALPDAAAGPASPAAVAAAAGSSAAHGGAQPQPASGANDSEARCEPGTCAPSGGAASIQPAGQAAQPQQADEPAASKQAAARLQQQQQQQQVPGPAVPQPQAQQGVAGGVGEQPQAGLDPRAEAETGALSILELQSGPSGRGGPSVYDMVKQEILGLKHNSTLAWHHVRALEHAVLQLTEAVAAAEDKAAAAAAEAERRAAAATQAARSQMQAVLREHEAAMKQLLSKCEVQLAGAKERSTTLMLLSAGQSGLLVLTGTLAYASRTYRRVMVLLAISNCLFGLYMSFKDHLEGIGRLVSL